MFKLIEVCYVIFSRKIIESYFYFEVAIGCNHTRDTLMLVTPEFRDYFL